MIRKIFNLSRVMLHKLITIGGSHTDIIISDSSKMGRQSKSLRRTRTFAKRHRHLIGHREEDGKQIPVYISPDALATHANAIGRTGRGKSKLMELLCRDYIDWGWGFFVSDPKGSAVDELLGYILSIARRTDSEAVLRRVVLIEITPDSVPSISALKWTGAGAEKITNTENALKAFFAKEADVLIEIVHRVMNEDEAGSPRIKRLLRAVFQAVAAAELDLVDSVTLLDPFDPDHDRVWSACKSTGKLPREVVSDIETIHNLKRPQDALQQVEGPINRLRSLLSPLIRAAFSDAVNAIDFDAIIRERKIVLLNCKETPFVSRQQAMTLASIVIHRIIEARFNMSDQEIAADTPFVILSDEAAETFGPDSDRVLRVGRSKKLILLLFTQNFSAYRHKEYDYTETVLNECGLLIAFQSKTPSPELLNVLLHGCLNLTKATREVDRFDGYDFLVLPSLQHSESRTMTIGESNGESRSLQRTLNVTHGESIEEGTTNGVEQRQEKRKSIDVSQSSSQEQSRRLSRGTSKESSEEQSSSNSDEYSNATTTGRDTTKVTSTGRRKSISHESGNQKSSGNNKRIVDERGYRRLPDGSAEGYANSSEQSSDDAAERRTESSSVGFVESSEESISHTERHATTQQHARRTTSGQSYRQSSGRSSNTESGAAERDEMGLRLTEGEGHTHAASEQTSLKKGRRLDQGIAIATGGAKSHSTSFGFGQSEGVTAGLSVSPLARHRTELETLPQLADSIEEQRERIAAELSTLGVAEVLMRDDTNCRTIRVRIREVVSPFESDDEFFAAIEEVRQRLRAMHPYMRMPDLSPEAEQRRIAKHLNRLQTQRVSQPKLADIRDEAGSEDKTSTPDVTPFH